MLWADGAVNWRSLPSEYGMHPMDVGTITGQEGWTRVHTNYTDAVVPVETIDIIIAWFVAPFNIQVVPYHGGSGQAIAGE